MTVETTTNRARYIGDGATTVFPFDFIIPSVDELFVYYTNVAGVTVLLASTAYVVTGIGSPDGGTVTYAPAGPIPANSILLIQRTVPYTQPVDLVNQDGFYPQVVEDGLDNLEYQVQQLVSVEDRNLRVGATDTTPGELPSAAARANQLLGFDGNGQAIAAQPSSALVSTAMQPVVSAGSLAAGRTAFGLGSIATENIGAGLQDDGAGGVRVNSALTSISGNQSILATDHMKTFIATGPITLALTRASLLWNGFGFYCHALLGQINLAVNINDTIEGYSSGVTGVIPIGCFAFITCDGAGTGNWRLRGVAPKFKQTLVLTASTTYIPSANLAYAEITLIGGGGAGGGAPGTAGSQASGGGGGGAGGVSIKTINALLMGSSYAVVIGAAGAAALGNTGGNGGDTTFSGISGFAATGGLGGAVNLEGPNGTILGIAGGSGGVGAGGDIDLRASNGDQMGILYNITGAAITAFFGGAGAPGYLGCGSSGNLYGGVLTPNAGFAFGAGGNGSANPASTASKLGGAGVQGACIIREFTYQL